MLAGDPPVRDPNDNSKLDEASFAGRALTYYGRWTYKYEMASARGAAGVLLVHETEAAGYPYDVVKTGAAKEQLMLADDPAAQSRVRVEGWLSEPFARSLFALAKQDFDTLKASANSREAKPVAFEARARLSVHSTLRRFESHNAIAALRGQDAKLREEAVILTAHWDHFGHDQSHEGDGIFNGAIDNASGVASLLAIARALVALPERPQRTILFLSPTAEEAGLLGAKHYANHPSRPLGQTIANVNMDCMNLWGRARTLVSVGLGTSTLDEVLAAEAGLVGRTVTGDLEPEKGYFFRSDHLELMRKGVPALHFLHPGADYEGKTAEESAALRKNYVTSTYHKVTDQADGGLRYEGAVDDARLLTRVVLDIANGDARPSWKPGRASMAQ
jgi:Zn-dependent M28 family amino/carboxypeptidase